LPRIELVYEVEQAMIPLNRTCRQVTALLVAREDRQLTIADRIALRFHIVICEDCPKFERQMLTLRNGMRQWRNYSHDESSKG
jgi:Putative zinc-finger